MKRIPNRSRAKIAILDHFRPRPSFPKSKTPRRDRIYTHIKNTTGPKQKENEPRGWASHQPAPNASPNAERRAPPHPRKTPKSERALQSA